MVNTATPHPPSDDSKHNPILSPANHPMDQQSTQLQENPNQAQKRRETQKKGYLGEEREDPKGAKPKTWKD